MVRQESRSRSRSHGPVRERTRRNDHSPSHRQAYETPPFISPMSNMEGLLLLQETSATSHAAVHLLCHVASVQVAEWNEVVMVRQQLAALQRRLTEVTQREEANQRRHEIEVAQLKRQHEAALEKARTDFDKAADAVRRDAHDELARLRQRNVEVLSANERLEAQVEVLRRTFDVEASASRNLDTSLSAELERVRTALEVSEAKVASADAVAAQQQAHIALLQQNLRDAEARAFRDAEGDARALETEFGHAVRRLRGRADEQLLALKVSRTELQEKVQSTAIRADRTAIQATQLRAEAAALRHERDVATQRAADAVREADAAVARARLARDELEGVAKDLASARQDLARTKKQSTQSVRDAQAAVEEADERAGAADSRAESLAAQLAAAADELKRLQSTMSYAALEAAREARQLAVDEHRGAVAELAQLRAALAAALDKKEQLQRRLEETESVVVGLRAHARGLDTRLRSVQNQLQSTVEVATAAYVGGAGGKSNLARRAVGDSAASRLPAISPSGR
eukprot:TRINITY_DN8326_c0_g1_i1.p2 TRINITY_DN8326_c0_g1~~TRINITY_DN8326_c0_g1_i1.p2  ORF type:complete len:517 (+),score=70.80 TRINITY_DN8326_c0_g1_i1:223-1773(+)